MRTSIATVCISGSLAEKMEACAAAGFDGIEILEADLVASELSPAEIRARADRLGLALNLYQPFRDFEGVTDDLLQVNLRRAEAKFQLMQELGVSSMLVCSNVATATIDDIDLAAAQLSQLGELAATYGATVAFEALAWGRFINDYRDSWRAVERADHPAVGLCLDSFHILSRGHDPAGIAKIPGEKIFFVQLADAPLLDMGVLSWSRHFRLFPGEGEFDLAGFLAAVVATGYDGPTSLEVFNDIFRQTEPLPTAIEAHRSLIWVENQARHLDPTLRQLRALPEAGPPKGFDFVEFRLGDRAPIESLLEQLGFTFRGRHATKDVHMWTSGAARVVVSTCPSPDRPAQVSGIGFGIEDLPAIGRRCEALLTTPLHRTTHRDEARLHAVLGPGGTEVFFAAVASGDAEPDWVEEFPICENNQDLSCIDHVNLSLKWADYHAAVLFYASVLGMHVPPVTEVSSLRGLVRSQVMRSSDGTVRLALNLAPGVVHHYPQHVAFACADIKALIRDGRGRGLRMLSIPANYYDDLQARFDLDDATIAELRAYDLLYDKDAGGEFLHFYTELIGDTFIEIVQRESYDGYGASDAPVRLAAQQRYFGLA